MNDYDDDSNDKDTAEDDDDDNKADDEVVCNWNVVSWLTGLLYPGMYDDTQDGEATQPGWVRDKIVCF